MSEAKTAKYYRVVKPNGESTGWLETSWREAENFMIGEALTGSRSTRREMLFNAYECGYKIEEIIK